MSRIIRYSMSLIACMSIMSCNAEEPINKILSENNSDWLISETKPYPSSYSQPCQKSGSVTEITYSTQNYADGTGEHRENSALVYTPHGYTDNADMRYDVLYLIHGHYGNEKTYFSVNNKELINVIDNMIANGNLSPLIIVTPTYNYGTPTANYVDANKYCEALPLELLYDLMPVVESRFKTYALSTDLNGFEASRDHRAIGGFSMGAVTTWYALDEVLPYFKYYIPISADCWSLGAFAGMNRPDETASYLAGKINVSAYSGNGFYIWAAAGTSDSAYSETLLQIQGMARLPDTFNETNISFHQKQGATHDYLPTIEYLYNALPLMFPVNSHSMLPEISIDDSDSQELYNIQGLKVTNPTSGGIYIAKGKKFIKK